MKEKKIFQFGRFLVGGAGGLSAYYITLYVLTEYGNVWYVTSAMIGFVLNYTINFIVQKRWTFQNKNISNNHREYMQYGAMALGLFISNALLLFVCVEYGRFRYLIAQVMITTVLTIMSFYITRKIFLP